MTNLYSIASLLLLTGRLVFGGWLFAILIMALFIQAGTFSGTLKTYLGPITIIALAGTLIESLPLRDIDNLTVTAIAAALGHTLF